MISVPLRVTVTFFSTPWIKKSDDIDDKNYVRDTANRSMKIVPRTNAGTDDEGNAEYLFKLERLDIKPTFKANQ